jgi:hypothetical protein
MDVGTSNVVLTQITMGTLFAGVLAYLKTAKWIPFVNKHSATINHIFLLLASAGTAIGVHAVWDSAAGSLTITGLSLTAILHGIWEWSKQWALQYLVQRNTFGPVSIPGDAPAVPMTPVAASGGTK